MSLVSPADLASFRTLNDENLPDRCAILGEVSVRGAGGTYTTTRGILPGRDNVPCRASISFGRNGNQEGVQGEQVTAMSGLVFTFSWDADVTREHSILYQGRTYEVIGTNAGASFKVSHRVQAQEVG